MLSLALWSGATTCIWDGQAPGWIKEIEGANLAWLARASFGTDLIMVMSEGQYKHVAGRAAIRFLDGSQNEAIVRKRLMRTKLLIDRTTSGP
eukprot:CAMPEP_0185576510 /NCGR_PEP_ID=MMETSP0434-20130131/7422_1 /TAXON_ID=626734 ORGANISM="Favella taraikaensis, Strain Fe Narragansett Bay" /NCGR_SAMPLE_ID=MMETSP0434 /ASSEMBLY_ACC=CAM_ASM_000379 /LENGTH=91 /DNA_ID=CAMNT_0028193745 /DNA_START=725 /DNA_END=1000 /DNA_ORIENTATION=+